jgi:hypothetical protein
MIDLLLLLTGITLLITGLWCVYPPLALILSGVASIALAYGRYRLAQDTKGAKP